MSTDTLYILGAGFSAARGLPLLDTFWDAIRNLRFHKAPTAEPFQSSLEAAYEDVHMHRQSLASIREVFQEDLGNLENLFSLLDLLRSIGVEESERAIGRRLRNLMYLMVRTLEAPLEPWTAGKNDGPLKLYQELLRCLGPRDAIISLNYDLVLEYAAAMLPEEVRPHFDYCFEIAPDRDYRQLAANGPKIPLLKIHGSANWRTCSRCNAYELFRLSLPSSSASSDTIAMIDYYWKASCRHCHSGDPDALEPVIVPPTWNKSFKQNAIGTVWKACWDRLVRCRRIVIIGYSLPTTDVGFRYLLTAGLGQNQHVEEVHVVDPAEETRSRFIDRFERNFQRRLVQYHPCRWDVDFFWGPKHGEHLAVFPQRATLRRG